MKVAQKYKKYIISMREFKQKLGIPKDETVTFVSRAYNKPNEDVEIEVEDYDQD